VDHESGGTGPVKGAAPIAYYFVHPFGESSGLAICRIAGVAFAIDDQLHYGTVRH
jgi:hypothetical protein